MERHSTSQKVLATVVGAIILAAATVMNIAASGSDVPHGLLVAALSLGVFAGARVIGSGAGKVSIVILLAMICGEAFNFSATAERIVIEREAKAAKVNALVAKRDEALKALHDLESGKITSPRLEIAIAAAEAAKDAVAKEAANGGCKKECKRKQGLADKAEAEVREAAAEASAMHQRAIEAATAEVKKNPLPPSGTALADRLHVPAWVLDLIMAGLLSFGSNILAGVLIGFGAHGRETAPVEASSSGQTDFDASDLTNVVPFFRPDKGNGPKRPIRPKSRPSGGLSKSEALDDLMKRLADGQTIPSDQTLANDWRRPKQTVHVWLKGWRKIGIIPEPVKNGRRNATVAC